MLGKVYKDGRPVPLLESLRPEALKFTGAIAKYREQEATTLLQRQSMARAGWSERIETVPGGERIIFTPSPITSPKDNIISSTGLDYSPTPSGAIHKATLKERASMFFSGGEYAEALEKGKGIMPKVSAFSSAAIGETISTAKFLWKTSATIAPKVRAFVFAPTSVQLKTLSSTAFVAGYGYGAMIKDIPKKPVTTLGKLAPYYVAGKGLGLLARASIRLAKPRVKLASDIEITSVLDTATGRKAVKVAPVEFVVELGKYRMAGRGLGEAAVAQTTKESVVKGVFKYETTVKGGKPPILSEVGYKGKFISEAKGFKGTGIYEAVTYPPGKKPITTRGVSVIKGKQYIGGDLPSYAFKTGEFGAGRLRLAYERPRLYMRDRFTARLDVVREAAPEGSLGYVETAKAVGYPRYKIGISEGLGKKEFAEVLRHEVSHYLDPQVSKTSFGRWWKKTLGAERGIQAQEDLGKLIMKKYDVFKLPKGLYEFDTTYYSYPKYALEREARATLFEYFPEEIAKPTTITGKKIQKYAGVDTKLTWLDEKKGFIEVQEKKLGFSFPKVRVGRDVKAGIGKVGLIHKEAEFPISIGGKEFISEKWRVAEAGAGTKLIKEMFPSPKPYPKKLLVSKTAEFRLSPLLEPPIVKPAAPMPFAPESVVGGEFLKGISRISKAEAISGLPRRTYIFPPLVDVRSRERGVSKSLLGQVTGDVLIERERVSSLGFGERVIPKHVVVSLTDISLVTDIRSKIRSKVWEVTKLRSKVWEVTKLREEVTFDTSIPPPSLIITTVPPPPIVPPPFFLFPGEKFKRVARKGKKGKFLRVKSIYTPSVEAIYLGIYGSKKGVSIPSLQFRPKVR